MTNTTPYPDELQTWIDLIDRTLDHHVPLFTEAELRAWARDRWGVLADAWESRIAGSKHTMWVITWGAGLDQYVAHTSQRITINDALRQTILGLPSEVRK